MCAKEIGDFGGSRDGSHITIGISQHPLAGWLIVFNSAGQKSQDDHVARVVRQLFWREEIVDQ